MAKPTYQYTQHPHAEKRKATGPVTTHKKVNDDSNAEAPVKTVSDRIGLAITKSVGTMWAAYVFFALTLVSLPAALTSGNVIIIVSWVAQTFLQLVLLPIIIVGQNIQAKSSDERAIATYEDAGAILEEAKEIQSHLGAQDEALEGLVSRVEKLEAKLTVALGKLEK